MMRPFFTGLLVLLALGTGSASASTLALQDYTGRGFAPDLVTYRFDGKPTGIPLLEGADGALVAGQFSKEPESGEARLHFVTGLPAHSNVTYTLRKAGKNETPPTTLAIERGKTLQLTTALLGIRTPPPQQTTFDPPVPARALPPPILAFRSGDGSWLGASAFLGEREAASLSVELTAEGPVFAELAYTIAWAGGGSYRAVVRVIDRVPLVKVTEDFDAAPYRDDDRWELVLSEGWAPDRAETARTFGNGGIDAGKVQPLEALAGKPLWYLVPDSAWGTPLSHLGLFNEEDAKARPASYTMVGYVPLHKGAWRRMNAVELTVEDGRTRLALPLSYRHASWKREVTSETSPFSMQEHEPGFPATASRRHWGLALNRPDVAIRGEGSRPIGPVYQLRMLYGVVGLDRYKDYILDWPDTGAAYPRLYLDAGTVGTYPQRLQASPLPEAMKERMRKQGYAAAPSDETGRKATGAALKLLRGMIASPLASPTIGHHHTAANYTIAAAVDDALGWPGLPAADRKALRSLTALLTYLWEEPDVISYGNGSHSGNPNMGTARFMSVNTFLALLPDHPMAPRWAEHMQAYTAYKTSTQTAPGGGYFEFGAAYHMHGGARIVNALPGLVSYGADNVEKLVGMIAPDWDYYMNLLTPHDTRWGSRMIPGMANSPPGQTEHFVEAAGGLAPHRPELAENLLWAWLANNANHRNANAMLAPVDLRPRRPDLGSAYYPGVGVVFRAHQGPDETYMLFRSGFNWSHWYIDQGHFILMSRGASLVPFQPYQYWNSKDPSFDLYNTMRFGHVDNQFPFGWPDSNILDTSFGERVDYAWSSTGYPDWYIAPGAAEGWRGETDAPVATGQYRKLDEAFAQTQGAFEWNRQVMFLKGATPSEPTYFVLRDSLDGEGRLASYLYLNLLGTRDNVSVREGRIVADTEWPVDLEVAFAGRDNLQPAFHEEAQTLASYNSNWGDGLPADYTFSPHWVDKEGQPLSGDPARTRLYQRAFERHVVLRIPAAPGEGYTWLLYPRTPDEPSPQVEALAEGALKITHPAGTDYVFLAPHGTAFDDGGIVFEGRAGCVRVGKEQVTLALNGGTGRVGYRGHVIEGAAPAEVSIPLRSVKPGRHPVAAPASVVTLPAPEADAATALADGVRRSDANGTVLTVVEAPRPVVYRDAAVGIEGTDCAVVTTPGQVRFVAAGHDYVKLTAGNVGVRGQGPFDLVFTGNAIEGRVDGRRRTLVTTWPEEIVRPMFHLDGDRYYAGWADDHSISKGTDTPQFALAFGILDGAHTVTVKDWVFPALPPSPERAAARW